MDSHQEKWGGSCQDLPIFSPNKVKSFEEDIVIIIAEDKSDVKDSYQLLARLGFDQKKLYLPMYDRLVAITGLQYFDAFTPHDHEIFVDAGSYDGQNSVDFVKWCKGRCDKIYAFEAGSENAKICENTISSLGIPFEVCSAACWSEEGTLSFAGDFETQISAGASVGSSGTVQVPAQSIDNLLDGQPVTFIKMDIEGSELAALHGAEQSIRKYRPRLAICIYHKPEDVYEIPLYILSLIPDYKFTIRHYSANQWETVLYAE